MTEQTYFNFGCKPSEKKFIFFLIKKAVSDRLFSRAIDYITLSGNQLSKKQTAAGLPENNLLVKVST